MSQEATPVGSIESRIICAETDTPYVSAAAAAVSRKEQIYRTYFVRQETANNSQGLVSIWVWHRTVFWSVFGAVFLLLRTLLDPFSERWWIFHRLQLLAFLKGCIIKSTKGSWSSLFQNHQNTWVFFYQASDCYSKQTGCWIKPANADSRNVVYKSTPIS